MNFGTEGSGKIYEKKNTASKPLTTDVSGKRSLQAQIIPGVRNRISCPKACPQIRIKAGITVEAAIALPLFLFTALMLLAPMKMLDERRQLQNVMEAAAKDMAQAAYIEEMIESGGKELIQQGQSSAPEEKAEGLPEAASQTGSGLWEGLKEGVNTGATMARILGALDPEVYRNPVFSRCQVLENDMIELELRYEMRLPFRIFGIESVPMSSVVNRRAWTGSSGGRGADTYGPGAGDEEGDGFDRDADGDRVVYVGKTSTVYHKNKHCHYLDNVLKKARGEDMDSLRNASGGRYHACKSCKPGSSGPVYILASGTAYHKSPDCRAIGAYAREAKLKDVEHLGPCSYCSKGGGHGS